MAKKKEREPIATVMLKPRQAGQFKRFVRDAKGNIKEKLVFESETPVHLFTKEQVEAVTPDIGNALVIVDTNQFGQPRVNWEMTQEVINERDGVEPAEKSEADETAEESQTDDKSADEKTPVANS